MLLSISLNASLHMGKDPCKRLFHEYTHNRITNFDMLEWGTNTQLVCTSKFVVNVLCIALNLFNDQEHWFNQSWYSLNFGTNQITFIRSASTQMSVNLFMIWLEHYNWLCYLFFIRYYIDYNWLCYLFFIRNYDIFLYFGKSLQITDKYALGMSGKSRFCLLGKQLLCLRHIFTESIHDRL